MSKTSESWKKHIKGDFQCLYTPTILIDVSYRKDEKSQSVFRKFSRKILFYQTQKFFAGNVMKNNMIKNIKIYFQKLHKV